MIFAVEQIRQCREFAGASAALLMAFGAAQAAPAAGAGDALRGYAQQESAVQDVYWRRHCHVAMSAAIGTVAIATAAGSAIVAAGKRRASDRLAT
jgi:hypothetical protein